MEAAGLLLHHLRSALLSQECVVTRTDLRTAWRENTLEHEDQEAETAEGCLEDWLPRVNFPALLLFSLRPQAF